MLSNTMVQNIVARFGIERSQLCQTRSKERYFASFPHLLMTKSPARVVLWDVGALVTVSGSGRHLWVRARPAPGKHLKDYGTMVQMCEWHSR